MKTISLRKRTSAGVVGAAATAMAIGALVQPTVAQAERVWDIGAYDKCVKAANDRILNSDDVQRYHDELRFCCEMSGGVWSGGKYDGKCEAPPATAQSAPQAPWEAGRAPRPESAAGGQTPGQGPPPPPPAAGGGTVTVVPRNSGWGWGFAP